MATRKKAKIVEPRITEETAKWILADEEDKLLKEDLAEKYTTSVKRLIDKAKKDGIKINVPSFGDRTRAYFEVDYRARREQFTKKFGPRPDNKADD